ncbi:MAG: PilZ domain-containing protein [Myxococcota bacterium]
MPSLLVAPRRRRALRRTLDLPCQAVELQSFRLLGRRLFDASPRGVLVACDDRVEPGEPVIVSFALAKDRYIDAEAEVARVVEGFRPHDRGYCAGLRFTHLERASRHELLVQLAGRPPVVPRRRPRPDYAETVRRIRASG